MLAMSMHNCWTLQDKVVIKVKTIITIVQVHMCMYNDSLSQSYTLSLLYVVRV
jgi:hypothetical protein